MTFELFPKLIELDSLSRYDEPTIQVVRPHEYNRLGHVKVASEALDYIKAVEPQPGRTIILVLAMTAGEFYGPNRNGDSWPERPLQVMNTKINEDQVLPVHHKSFETDANIFKHHVNKDPNKRIGDVLKSFYNWPMHRVELLLSLDNDRAEDIVSRIENEEFPAVSMGCKVKHDICSICGHRAPNRKAYCDHAKFRLGDYLPNGKRVFVWNPSPRFFDISMVRRPADRLGFMMKKVADSVPEIRSSAALGAYVQNAGRKIAALNKMSLIHKILRGAVGASKNESGNLQQFVSDLAKPMAAKMPAIDDETIRSLIQFRPAEVLSTLSSMGILLTTPEFIKYFIWKIDPTLQIPEDVLDRTVATQQQVFEMLTDNPKLLDEIDGTDFIDTSDQNVNPNLASKLQPLAEKRSQSRDNLYRVAMGKTGHVAQLPTHERPLFYRERPDTRLPKLAGAAALLSAVYGMQPSRKEAEVMMRPFDDSPEGCDGEFTYKVSSFEGLDEPNTMLRMALDFSHRKRARTVKAASLPATFPDELSFEEAAFQLGGLICPSN
jgi:hypothetical protein